MTTAQIFKDIHGAVDINTLISLADFTYPPGYPSENEFEECISYLEIENQHIFINPTSLLHRIVYWNEFNYYPFDIFSLSTLQLMDIKKRLHVQNERFREFKKENDYDSIFMFMDKKLLIPMYKKLFDVIPIEQRYEIFVNLHMRSEYGFEMFDHAFLKKVFLLRTTSPAYHDRMMELKNKISNSEKFLIYHGHNKNYDPKDEYSWTLSKNTAFFFANRFNKTFEYEGKITKKYIGMKDVIDYFPDRGEEEIILLTDQLK